MLVAFGASQACRCASSVITIIVKDIAFILHSLWLPALLRADPSHQLARLLPVLTNLW